MPDTLFYPPVKVGKPTADGTAKGGILVAQTVTLTQNSTTAVTSSIIVPPCRVHEIIVDGLVLWNSGTSATLTVGTAAAGSQLAGSIDLKTAVRVTPTYTAAQLAALVITAEDELFITATPSGATSAGTTRVTIVYEPS